MISGQTVAFTVFGGALAAAGIKMIFQTLKVAGSMSWASTTGRVLTSELVLSRSRDSGGGTYDPRVVYEYTVDGRTYTGSTISLIGMQGSSDKDFGRRVLIRYPAGDRCVVYYNPDRPSDCCIENKAKTGNVYMGVFASVLLILAGLALALFGSGVL